MTYEKESLGTMVVFLLPSLKLKSRKKDSQSLEDKLHHFLLQKYKGYTATTGNVFGYWKSKNKEYYGEHKEYKVSLLKKSELSTLESFLANLALQMYEDCIYISAGNESWLIYPHKTKGK